jgi:hypothetical protein
VHLAPFGHPELIDALANFPVVRDPKPHSQCSGITLAAQWSLDISSVCTERTMIDRHMRVYGDKSAQTTQSQATFTATTGANGAIQLRRPGRTVFRHQFEPDKVWS